MAKFLKKLEDRKLTGSLRSLSLFQGFSDFFSNDYLGLSKYAFIKNSPHSGSTGSRLLSGNSEQAEAAEHFIARFFHAEAALIFNSGYDANLGVFSAVPQRGDTILYDELIHASVRDGIRLSHAKNVSFKHNDTEDLKRKILKSEGSIFVAVESLYSMDGDIAPLVEIAEICNFNNIYLIVDEAHSGGILGKEGRGLCEALNITNKVFARVFTFGKAYGTHGAAVLGSEDLKNYLINFARSFIYTTALPPEQYLFIQQQIENSKPDFNREKLQQNIALFRNILNTHISLSNEKSPVQIILIPGVENAKKLADTLQKERIAVKAIFSPTVPEGGERLRFCIHTFNTEEEINSIGRIIHQWSSLSQY